MFTLYAWVIICILTYRPIGGKYYGPDELYELPSYHQYLPDRYLEKLFTKSDRYLRAARIVQSLVSVLTIPLTSAVCSQAAVVYTQQKRGSNRPALRQSMAIADKGWTDIAILRKLFFGGWRKHKSSLLLIALLLNILGAAISPVQQLFLSYKTIKRMASKPTHLPPITQFTDLFPDIDAEWGMDWVKLRSALTSVVNDKAQTRLWSPGNATVTSDERLKSMTSDSNYSPLQTKSQNTFANFSTIVDPFWAQLPSNTNTGLLQMFAARLNSTAKWENNSADVLPADCHSSSDALYFHYEYANLINYDIEV
ncbi:unnamed protein product [Penicillium salamii]|nr:unnamed protein product [Penicillium salamii]